jgi:uncharacterized membrane-anchored protein
MYIVPLKWFDIRDIYLLFLVLSALIVFIMHELNNCKNLLQKCTVIQYCCIALVIFEVIYDIVMYMHYIFKNLRKLWNSNPIFMP